VDEFQCILDITDHSQNSAQLKSPRDETLLQAEGFIVCYGVDTKESFESVKHYAGRLNALTGYSVGQLPCLLLGCKSDLDAVSDENGGTRRLVLLI
jgi:hypothetical protein